MKKLILSVAMLLATSFTAMADDNNSNEINMVEAYDINININSLARYLDLSKDQIESIETVHKAFSEGMKMAAVMDGESRKNMTKNAIDYDLKHMNYILTDEQYKKYVKILNITLNNRGVNK